MASALKQFAILISNFIDNSLMPIIQNKMHENTTIIDQWRDLKAIILDTETIEIKKVENFIINNCQIKKNHYSKQLSSDDYDKHSLNVNSPSYSSQFDNAGWRYAKYGERKEVEERKQEGVGNMGSTMNSQEQGGLKQKNRDESSRESFEIILSSFRKLCNNFQNNHKQLVREKHTI